MKSIRIKIQTKPWIVFLLLFIISLIVTIQHISLGVNNFWGGQYTFYNNFVIFKSSFAHLIHGNNLYDYYATEYADLFKYSPSFALLMGAFHFLPDGIGLFLWNTLNISVLYYSFITLKSIETSKRIFLILYVLFDLILSTQNSQSNALLAGLTILSFNLFEQGKNSFAVFLIVLGIFIKIFSVIGCLFILLYPNKLKSILSYISWFLIFLLSPLILIDYSELIWQYENWFSMLRTDQSESVGMSIFAFTQYLFPSSHFKMLTHILGALILLSPLLKIKQPSNTLFRVQYLSLMLIWIVVFNHKAESPTFVIALSGIAIWFFSKKQNKLNLILISLALFFTSIWFTDIVPPIIKNNVIELSYIKSAFPIILLFVIYFHLINFQHTQKAEMPDLAPSA